MLLSKQKKPARWLQETGGLWNRPWHVIAVGFVQAQPFSLPHGAFSLAQAPPVEIFSYLYFIAPERKKCRQNANVPLGAFPFWLGAGHCTARAGGGAPWQGAQESCYVSPLHPLTARPSISTCLQPRLLPSSSAPRACAGRPGRAGEREESTELLVGQGRFPGSLMELGQRKAPIKHEKAE